MKNREKKRWRENDLRNRNVCLFCFLLFFLAPLGWQVLRLEKDHICWFSAAARTSYKVRYGRPPAVQLHGHFACSLQRLQVHTSEDGTLRRGWAASTAPTPATHPAPGGTWGGAGEDALCSLLPWLAHRPFWSPPAGTQTGSVSALFPQLQVISSVLLNASAWNCVLCICLITKPLGCL